MNEIVLEVGDKAQRVFHVECIVGIKDSCGFSLNELASCEDGRLELIVGRVKWRPVEAVLGVDYAPSCCFVLVPSDEQVVVNMESELGWEIEEREHVGTLQAGRIVVEPLADADVLVKVTSRKSAMWRSLRKSRLSVQMGASDLGAILWVAMFVDEERNNAASARQIPAAMQTVRM